MIKICLDAGHGGFDPGAISFSLKEKDLTLEICNFIEAELRGEDKIKIIKTRDSDKTVSLYERISFANKNNADYFISIHINSAANKLAKGFESFVYTKASEKAIWLQSILHGNIAKLFEVDRGKKRENFFVLRETKMPAILLEFGFISNDEDYKNLKNTFFKKDIAKAVAEKIRGLAQ